MREYQEAGRRDVAGTFYGISVGPGDPGLITIKAASILSKCRYVFAPESETGRESMALEIARAYISEDAEVCRLLFPMTTDEAILSRCWSEAAARILQSLQKGDACFLTIGDSLLYSTYIYLLRALESAHPGIRTVTIPGINSFSAAAALTNFTLGEGKMPVSIVPVDDDLQSVRSALDGNGTVVLMKIGKRLADVLVLLEEAGLIDEAVFVARAGQNGERIVANLRDLNGCSLQAGYLSLILVHAGKRGDE